MIHAQHLLALQRLIRALFHHRVLQFVKGQQEKVFQSMKRRIIGQMDPDPTLRLLHIQRLLREFSIVPLRESESTCLFSEELLTQPVLSEDLIRFYGCSFVGSGSMKTSNGCRHSRHSESVQPIFACRGA